MNKLKVSGYTSQLKSFNGFVKSNTNTFKRAILIEKINKDMIDIFNFQKQLVSALRMPKRFLNNE
jgi:hypothetical protein